MHGDLEMLMGILNLKALPSICLAFTCDYGVSCAEVMLSKNLEKYYNE